MYYRARFYHPALGRFVSADTIVPDPANPQNFNRYIYVGNNSINRVDLSGHNDIPWWLRWVGRQVSRVARNPRTWQLAAGAQEIGRIARGGEVTRDDWELAADILVPAESDASVVSLAGTVSLGPPGKFFTLSGDLVTTAEGQVQAFVSVRDTELLSRITGRYDMGRAEGWLRMASDDVAPIILPPQASLAILAGPVFGNEFASTRAGSEAFAGPALNYGGVVGPFGANAFHSFNVATDQPTTDVVGVEGGVSGGPSLLPVGININATYAIPTGLQGKLEGPMLLACRLAGGCGVIR
jgi:hypothetical protein